MTHLPRLLLAFLAGFLWCSISAQADSKSPLGLEEIEIIIKPTEMMKPTMVEDHGVKVDGQGHWHYRVKGRFFDPAIPLLSKEENSDPTVQLLKKFIAAAQQNDLKTVSSLYHPDSAAPMLKALEDPKSAKALMAQYANLQSYDLTLIVEYGGEGKAVAFSKMTTSAASAPGYPPLGLVSKDGKVMLEMMRGRPGFLYNVMLGLNAGVIEIKPVK